MTTEVDLIFVGRRLTVKNALAYFYEPVGKPGTLRGFKRPLVTGHKIGTIVRIQEDGDGYYTSGANGPQAIAQSTDEDQLLRWSIEQEADVAQHQQQLESKRIVQAGQDPLRTVLAPIRDQLAGMSSARRAATVGWIITFLLTGQRR
jgi:hypothetical protein